MTASSDDWLVTCTQKKANMDTYSIEKATCKILRCVMVGREMMKAAGKLISVSSLQKTMLIICQSHLQSETSWSWLPISKSLYIFFIIISGSILSHGVHMILIKKKNTAAWYSYVSRSSICKRRNMWVWGAWPDLVVSLLPVGFLRHLLMTTPTEVWLKVLVFSLLCRYIVPLRKSTSLSLLNHPIISEYFLLFIQIIIIFLALLQKKTEQKNQ